MTPAPRIAAPLQQPPHYWRARRKPHRGCGTLRRIARPSPEARGAIRVTVQGRADLRSHILAAAAVLFAAPAFAQTPERTVFFDLGSARIDAVGLNTIEDAASDFADTGSTSVSIVGHTDTTGSPEINRELSRRRAEAVKAEMIARGVPESEIVTAWRGESELAVMTGDDVAEPQNRRAEIVLAEPAAPMSEAAPLAPVADMVSALNIGVGPYVGFNMQDDDESVFLGANVSASYFVTPNVALGAEQAVFYNLDADDEGWGGRSAASVDYFFGEYGHGDGVAPYVGVNGGYMYIDGSGTGGWFAGPEIGANFFGIRTRLAYDFVEDRDAEEGVISLTIGYDFRF